MLGRLKEVREARGYSQASVASALDVPLGTYRNWEQGRNMPSDFVTLYRISNFLGVDLSDIIDEPVVIKIPEPFNEKFPGKVYQTEKSLMVIPSEAKISSVEKVIDPSYNPFFGVPDERVEYSYQYDHDDFDGLLTARVMSENEYNKKKLLENYDKLNDDGQGHLVEYSYVLTKMEEYQSE